MTTDTTPSPPPPPMKRSLRWLLILSLGLNLLVAGVVAGGLVRGGFGGRPPAVELALGPFARALSPEDRRAIAGDLLGRADLRDMRRSAREADVAALAAALRADPFDPAAVSAALAAQRDKLGRLEAAVEAALLARFTAMTPADRAALADRIAAEAGHHHGGD